MAFLDTDGLAYYHGKIKALINEKMQSVTSDSDVIINALKPVTGMTFSRTWNEDSYYYGTVKGSTIGDVSSSSVPKSNPLYICTYLACSEGDLIHGYGLFTGEAGRLYGFVDSNGVLLSTADTVTEATAFSVYAPANSAYVYLNTELSSNECYLVNGHDFVQDVETLKASADATNAFIATTFSENETCTAGHYYINEGKLYKCSETVTGNWTDVSLKMTEVTLDSELASMQSSIDTINGTVNVLGNNYLKYSEAQTLDDTQKQTARENIGLGDIDSLVTGTVKYDTDQTDIINEEMQAIARKNIGAASANDLPTGVVIYSDAQELTDTDKAQARSNIGSASSSELNTVSTDLSELEVKVDSYGNAVGDVIKTESGIRVDYIDGSSNDITIETGGMSFDGGYVDDDNYLHLTYLDTDLDDSVFTPILLPATGGGGGGATVGTVTITRVTSASAECIYGDSMSIDFTFAATDSSGDLVGDGTGTWYVGGVAVAKNINVAQGSNSFDISPYLTSGTNNVKLSVSVDTGGDYPQTATKTWTVNAVDLYFVWSYDDSQINTSSFTDRWTPYGNISKTTHTSIDGTEIATSTTARSGSQQSIVIPMQTHGAHGIERWLTAEINGTEKDTAHQYHEAIFVEDGNTTPIVAISFMDATVDQYDTVEIPYVIYDPSDMTTEIEFFVDNESAGVSSNVDRSAHKWYYTPTTSGTHTLSIKCGNTSSSVTLSVNPVELDVEEVSGYTFKFKASDFASNDGVKSWNSNDITATFSNNFDWINGGLQSETDDDGNFQQYVCVKAGTTMTINHKMFSSDVKKNGMTYKIIFKVKNVRDYDTRIAHCFANDVGLQMYAHNSIFKSSGTSVSVPYGENEYIELEFDVYPAPISDGDGNYRYIMAWADGVITSCRVYGDSDSFVQANADQENIVIGSNDCDVDIYMVKAYPVLVSRDGHIDNFIMDAPNASEMIERYHRNNILDESGEIDYEKLMTENPDCRVWLYDIPYLTTGKKDKVKNCSFQQFWSNGDSYYNLTGTGTMTVQGTSSVKYVKGAANTDFNFTSLTDGNGNDLMANGVQDETYGNNWYEMDPDTGGVKIYTVEDGETLGPECVAIERDSDRNVTKYIKALGYKINDDSCPITYSNTKVNFASCEQVNNMCNAQWYQKYNPYPSLTARDCMEFTMGVQFIKDSGTVPDDSHFVLWGDNKYHMYSIGNMGTSKKNVHLFHDLSNANEVCIEVNDNDKDQMRMVSDDLSTEDWSGDVFFGMRYPDTKNPAQEVKDAWQRLVTWMATNNPNAYTGETLDTPETYDVYTFKGHDRPGTQVLKGTTVKQYAGTYTTDSFERRMAKMLSECEDYMVMDSFVYHFVYLERHTMADNVSKNNFWSSTDLIHWDLSKAYDMDTSDGNNNQGQMVFDYGNEYNDNIGGMKVFNGSDSVWFVFVANLYEACQTMFINREAEGAWSAAAYHAFLLEQQKKVPERCWVQCYWYDYLRTYEQGISTEWMTFLDGGQKTHQRKHYEFFEELYDSSKYRGTVSTSQNVNFRAYTPNTWSGVEPKGEITITMYNKMYISLDVGTTQWAPIKAERGVPITIDFSSGGKLNDTMIVINTAPMIQAINGMEQLYPNTCVFSMATRLRELTIGSTAAGYSNTFLKSLALENNTLLEYLYVQNLPNATSVLDLSNCSSLLYLDATGSGFTGYDFADGGLVETAIINKPTSLSLRNLNYLTDDTFSVADFSILTTLRFENVPNVNALNIISNASALQTVRVTGIDWSFDDSTILDVLYELQGIDENGYTIAQSIVTGNAYVATIKQRILSSYNSAWPDLIITYDTITPQYAVSFYNDDGTAILDSNGNNYVQYVDYGALAYDPVEAGEVDTPTKDSTAQYAYTFTGWDIIDSIILKDTVMTATYEENVRTYTVTWMARDGVTLKTLTGVKYGAEAVYDENDYYNYPILTDEESSYYYKVFKGWDKSTGFITEDTTVTALWDVQKMPAAGTLALNEMSVGQIYSIVKNYELGNVNIADYWQDKDYFDITLGDPFDYGGEVLIDEQYFDGETVIKTDIQLFNSASPSFTMVIDFEFHGTTTDSTLVSCFQDDGSEGFRLRYASGPNIQWGDKQLSVGTSYQNGRVVLRHQTGSNVLYVATDNIGTYQHGMNITYSALKRSRDTDIDTYLTFGGVPYSDSVNEYMGKGWIHFCKIWYEDLGETNMKRLANLQRYNLRMEYCGTNRYRLSDDSSQKCSASFIANNLLPFGRRMNSSNTNSGGWNNSELRTFMSTRIFGAFPPEWQSLIKSVRVPGAAGLGSYEILYSDDKVYIPSLIEVIPTSSLPFTSEGSTISFFTANKYRFKFRSYVIDDDIDSGAEGSAKYITEPTDPTLLSDVYTVNPGDIWIDSSNSDYTQYRYISEDEISKHTQVDWALVSDIIAAEGTQGGAWKSANNYWTRSPRGNNNYYFYHVRAANGGSSASSSSSGSYYAIDLCFSI